MTGTNGTRDFDWDKGFLQGQLGQGLLTGTTGTTETGVFDWNNRDKAFDHHWKNKESWVEIKKLATRK